MAKYDIDANKLYSVSEAAKLLPSPQGKEHLTEAALRVRIRKGQIKATKLDRYWYIPGSEIIAFLRPAVQEIERRDVRQRSRDADLAEQKLKQLGMLD